MKLHKEVCFALLVIVSLTVAPSAAMEIVESSRDSTEVTEEVDFGMQVGDTSRGGIGNMSRGEIFRRKLHRESSFAERERASNYSSYERAKKLEYEVKKRTERKLRERLEAQQKKEKRELRTKSSFRWSLFGFVSYLLSGFGVGYAVNTYEVPGDFFKKVFKPTINSFFKKYFVPLGGLCFSRYAFLRVGDMISDATEPVLIATKQMLIDTMEEGRPECSWMLNDALSQVKDLIDEGVEQQIPLAIEQVEGSLERQVDKLVKKTIPTIGDHVNKIIGNILDSNTPKIRRLVKESAEGGAKGGLKGIAETTIFAPSVVLEKASEVNQTEEELEKMKNMCNENNATFDVNATHSPGVVGTLFNAAERRQAPRVPGRKKSDESKKKKE